MLPQIDVTETKKKAEEQLLDYQNQKSLLEYLGCLNSDDRFEPFDKETQKSVDFIKKVDAAISQLDPLERRLIKYRYLEENNGVFDYIARDKMGIGDRSYYRIKPNALMNLAKHLRVVVFKENS